MTTRASYSQDGVHQERPLRERLEALARFRPIFCRGGFRFAERIPSRVEDGVIVLGGTCLGEAAMEFVGVAEEYGWVRPFAWPEWSATETGQRLMRDPEALAHADPDDLVKVITTCIRAERFCDGYLANAFDEGLLGRVIARVAQLAEECSIGEYTNGATGAPAAPHRAEGVPMDTASALPPSPAAFAPLLDTFRYWMTSFDGFEARRGTYYEQERAYKDELVAAYQRLLIPLLSAPEGGNDDQLHEAMCILLTKEKLPSAGKNKVQNLIPWNVTDYLWKIQKARADAASSLLRDFLRGPGMVFERLDRFYAGYLPLWSSVAASGGQQAVRSLATLLLMLDDPAHHLFVKLNSLNAVARQLFSARLIGHGSAPNGAEYQKVLDLAAVVEGLLRAQGWPPKDKIDVQGFVWVAGGGYGPLPSDIKSDKPPGVKTLPLSEPSFADIVEAVKEAGLRIEERMLRRYHAALRSRGFVVLAGLSGTGKTWLTRLYAGAVGARYEIVAVAPNWTGPEDLLGYLNPLNSKFSPTAFTVFLEAAAAEWEEAKAQERKAQEYHLVLDEMNLARVEHYFARFLSAMEIREQSPGRVAEVELHPGRTVTLTPNLRFIGTVNVDETTHGFADKVFDRAQLVELETSREMIAAQIGEVDHKEALLRIWDAVREVAPFAFRVVDDIDSYVDENKALGIPWLDALDEQVLQKVLPKLRGNDPRIGTALQALRDACEDMPLSRARVIAMLQRFMDHGLVSFF